MERRDFMIVDDKYIFINAKDLWTILENCGYSAGRKKLTKDDMQSENVIFEINIKTLSCKVRVIEK